MSRDIGQIAVDYLARLHEDETALPPQGASEASHEWAHAFLAAIRDHRNRHPDGEARKAACLFGRSSAKDRYRFFWEFWQNADDARASRLCFRIRPGELIVENDGVPFAARDVYSVCFVASSQKSGDIAQKGQFGIGLLSLMRICQSPEIHSGPFHFRVERDYTYPELIEDDSLVPGTRVVVPLRQDVDLDELRSELVHRLQQDVLLYMSHLRSVEVSDERTNSEERIECAAETDQLTARAIRLGDQRWLRYTAVVKSDPNLQREDGEPIPEELAIVLPRCESVKGPHRVAAFFPTELFHSLPWRFSAPFEVTNNRESLQDSPYNHWLLARVGESMVDAALDPSVGDPGMPWRLVPALKVSEEELRPLYEAAHEKLRRVAWVPTGQGLRRVDEIAIPASEELRLLIKPKDAGEAELSRRVWLSGTPEEAEIELLTDLGACFVCCHELSMVLASGPRRNRKWYLRAAAEAIRLAEESRRGTSEVFERLREGSCFKDRVGRSFSLSQSRREGKVICSARSQLLAEDVGRIATPLMVMLHDVYRIPERKRSDPLDELRERVNGWLRRESGDHTFRYEYRLDAPRFIRHFIVEADQDYLEKLDGRTHDSLLGFVRDHLDAYVSTYRQEDHLAQIANSIRVTAFSHDESGRRISARHPLSDVYLGKSFTDSRWADAARGVPDIWWLSAKYRKLLARESENVGVTGFLRRLGVGQAPRPVLVPQNASHGTHRFTHVTRGDERDYPHFPHDAVSGWYTAYGTRGDHVCPDLDAVLAFLAKLPSKVRGERGGALLRTLEQHWDMLEKCAEAQAYYYYSNAEHHIAPMPSRWLFNLRNQPWMKFGDGKFRLPTSGLAATDSVKGTVGVRDPDICAWDCKNETVARALGLGTTVPAPTIIERLRESQRAKRPLSINRAAAYYTALARQVEKDPEGLGPLEKEELIYLPTKARTWWTPDRCLTSDQSGVFGDRRAYLSPYRDATALWRHLGIESEPTVDNLKKLWEELSSSVPDQGTLAQLQRGYVLADNLCSGLSGSEVVPVWTSQGWQPSDRTVATEDDDLWTALGDLPLPRWTQPRPQAFSELCRWAQIALIDKQARFEAPRESGQTSDIDTQVLRSATRQYAKEAARVDPGLWERIAPLAERWVDIKVVRVNSLEIPVQVDLPKVGSRDALVRRRALVYDGRLYLSSLTEIHEADVGWCLLRDAALTPSDTWNVQNGLRLKLIEAAAEGPVEMSGQLPPVRLREEETQPDTDLFDELNEEEGEEAEEGPGEEQEARPPMPSRPPASDIENLEIESDETGNQTPLRGGATEPEPISPRPPKAKAPGKPHREAPRPPARTVEQRGLDIFVHHVLDPAGVRISDQRLRAGVGADLFCSDQVFRELKTFSGRAPDRIRLSRYEQARALASLERYELVVVEHVWEEPIITIISNPMESLRWRPTGDVEVIDWRSKAPSFRVITLRKQPHLEATQDSEDDSGPGFRSPGNM